MKNLKKIMLSLLGLVLFIPSSCGNDYEYPYPYYEFSDTEKALIINYDYKPEQIITYKNQFDKEIHFKVLLNELNKLGDYSEGTFSGGGGILESYYDSKIIRFEIVENLNFEKRGFVNYMFSKSSDIFRNGIKFPLWNVANLPHIDGKQNPIFIKMLDFNFIPKIEMDINNHLFEKIVVINSGSDESEQNQSFSSLPLDVNKIYYDYDFGIVQFDDLEGNEWKLIYPE